MTKNETYISPVRYADGFYHIGTSNYPSWLLESTDGIILIDTAMPENLDFLLSNIKALGYDYRDIKHIIHSHGHIDHMGCTKAIVGMTGAKTYIGSGDEDSASGRNELQWTNEFGIKYEGAFEPDVILHDREELIIGDRKFLFISTPGHTAGTMSIFFNLTDNGKEYRAGMFGGAGLNSMEMKYLEKYSLPVSLRDDFLSGMDKVYEEKVDIHVGNHLGNNRHFEKAARLGGEVNPFIDSTCWKRFIDERRALAIKNFNKDK